MELGVTSIILHPGIQTRGIDRQAHSDGGHVLPALPFAERNREIVWASAVMLFTPGEMVEQQRSGTWATWRLAGPIDAKHPERLNRERFLILPDGTVQR